ncbi:glycoside hydrolase family 26 protein [Streptomyces sp. NPDC059578]|uniref:glycoside hydrolase family 26 protein n=1 Tax=unclassified Streptomyces TaxID=2593676 RepID=UPI0036465D7B
MVPQQCRTVRGRAARGRFRSLAVSAVAWVAFVSGTAHAAGPDPDPVPSAPAATEPAAEPAPDPASEAVPGPVPEAEPAPDGERSPFGAYLDYGPRGVERMAELSQWLGGAELKVGHSYLPGDSWAGIEGEVGFLADWAGWRSADRDRMFVLNVPMSARNEQPLSDFQVRSDLWRGAFGWYDGHFRKLAERLVRLGLQDTVLVLGWEMNGTTYSHRCAPDPGAWKRYWKRIVTTMRSVSGQEFRFDFAPSRGKDAIGWTACYPGDDTVDIIGMDSYDQPSGLTFDEQVSEPYGLQHHVDFARARGKPISYPEWGLFRNGDNADYMRRMIQWVERHRPVYHTISDYCPHGVWQCGANPQAAAVYRELLSDGPSTELPLEPEPVEPVDPVAPAVPVEPTEPVAPVEPSATEPAAAPASPAPAAPECTPVGLGGVLGKWLDGLCVPQGRGEAEPARSAAPAEPWHPLAPRDGSRPWSPPGLTDLAGWARRP